MAFPSTSTTALEKKWSQIKDTAARLKNEATQQIAASSITRKRALEYGNLLADSLDLLNTQTAGATTNGLVAYAQNQENNPSLDIVSEYNTMKTALIAVQNWLVANFPSSASELLVYSFDVNKRFADINLTAPQLSAYKTQLTNLANTIA